MPRTSTSLTATVTLVRNELLPQGTSQDVLVEVAVKASDLAALLTAAEKAALSYPGQQPALALGFVITDDAGAGIGDKSSAGVVDMTVVGALTAGLTSALAAYLRTH